MSPEVRALTDRTAIADLLAIYCRALDTMELDLLREVFDVDASVAFGPDPRLNATGLPGIVAALSRLWRWRRTAHHLGNLEIRFEGEDRARARSSVIAWHERPDGTTATLYGVYLDEVVRRPEGWRILCRRQETNGSVPAFPIGIFPAPRRPPPPGWTAPDIETPDATGLSPAPGGAMPDDKPSVAFVGVGAMAEAMVERALGAGWSRDRLFLTHRRAERRVELAGRFGGSVVEDNAAAVRAAELVVVAVRPQELGDLLAELSRHFRPGQVLVSIAAGLTVAWLRTRLPDGVGIVRVTPPPTARIGAGVALLSADAAVAPRPRTAVENLVRSACERVEWVEDELMEPITGVAFGLTPYTCRMLTVLIETGIEQGVDPAFCRRMIMDGIWATARLLKEEGVRPEDVVGAAATREGLTWAALHTMEAAGVPAGIRAGARAMTGRSFELRGEQAPPEYQGFSR